MFARALLPRRPDISTSEALGPRCSIGFSLEINAAHLFSASKTRTLSATALN